MLILMATSVFAATYFLAQVATAIAPEVGVSNGEAQASLQVILAFVLSGVMTWMKASSLSGLQWIGKNTPFVAKLTSATSAMLVTAGIAFSQSGSFNTAEGITFTIAGISMTGITKGFATFLSQWGFQHVFYNAAWRKTEPVPSLPAKADPGTGTGSGIS